MVHSPVVSFYLGDAPDSSGRWLGDLLDSSDEYLEEVHDYIQWLFPLTEPSLYNSEAPLLSDQDLMLFRESTMLQKCVLRSLERMLAFYGLELTEMPDGTLSISPDTTFVKQAANWLTWGNHNYQRLTRILRSLRLLDLDPYAQALFVCLDRIYQIYGDQIPETSYNFWEDAVNNADFAAA